MPLILRPKKRPIVWRLLITLFFIGIASSWDVYFFIGWVGFFGVVALDLICRLIPGRDYLRIADDGISYVFWFRVKTIPWGAIDHFCAIMTNGLIWTVGFNYAPLHDRAKILSRISAILFSGPCEDALPQYYAFDREKGEKKAEELADILNRRLAEFREKAATGKTGAA